MTGAAHPPVLMKPTFIFIEYKLHHKNVMLQHSFPRLGCELEELLAEAEGGKKNSMQKHPVEGSFPLLLTGCLSQQSFMAGRIFLCTTTSCRSSRDGCWPTSSSNGSMYSPVAPNEVNEVAGMEHSRDDVKLKACSPFPKHQLRLKSNL